MDLHRIQARGLKGFSQFDGDVAFDFRALPEGLVAIVGANGSGKTTMLEAALATFYGEFPSRPDNGLIDSVEGKDAYLEAELGFDARGIYRARVNVDALRRATDAVLELTTPDGRRQALNDGKISTFAEAVRRELPNLALVKASAFAAQSKAGSFSDLSKKDRKDVFASLLGLEIYEQYAQTSRDAVAVLDRVLAGRREVLARLRRETGPDQEDELSRLGNELQVQLGDAELTLKAALQRVESLERQIDACRQHAARYVAATAEREAILQRRADRAGDLAVARQQRADCDRDEAADVARRRGEADRAIAVHQAAIAALDTPQGLEVALTAKLHAIQTVLDNRLHQRQQKIANNRGLLDRQDAIRQAARAVEAAQAEHVQVTAQLDEARRVEGEAQQLLSAARRRLEGVGDPAALLARAKQDAALIDTVPFGERCATAGCLFVQQAVEARERIPDLEAQVALVERRRTDLEAARRAAEAAALTVAEFDASLRQVARRLQDLSSASKEFTLLQAAEARVAELEEEQQQLRAEAEQERSGARAAHQDAILRVGHVRADHLAAIERIRQQLDVDVTTIADAWRQTRVALDTRAAALAGDLDDLDRQAEALATVAASGRSAHERLVALQTQLDTARQAHTAAVGRRAAVEQQCEAFEVRRARYLELLRERDALAGAVAALETELIDWQALAKIFGRDGLPVLEIDAAGPAVSALANDLLQSCFGGRFTIEIVTQEPKADGKGFKEVFEIRVTDSERATEPDLSDLSGGERVIVDEAIRSALALYINQRNVQPLLTCFRDETVGALDPENAGRYVQMLRRIQQRGGFRRVLYISHNPEASALADAQIWIHDGRIDTLLPPFARTEAA